MANRKLLPSILMGIGGGLSGQNFLGAYARQEQRQLAMQQAFRQWQARRGIVDYAQTPAGMGGYTQGVGVMPVKPWLTPAGEAKIRGTTKAWSPSQVDKVLGRLEAGGYVDPMTGRRFKWKTREQLEFHALSTLGTDWKERVPEALEIIDRKFPPEKPTPKKTKKSWWLE